MISLCIPTRERPQIFKEMCQSALDTAKYPDNIEFVIYRDDDDLSEYEYIGNHIVTVGPRINVQLAANECQRMATGLIYMFVADDILFETRGWDEAVEKAFEESKDKIILVYMNDHFVRSNFGIIGFLHKNWVDTVGYFLIPELCRGGDCWINDMAKAINRRVYIGSKENGRHSFKDRKILDDKTHLEHLAMVEQTDNHERSKQPEVRFKKEEAIQKLKNFICNFQ